MLHREMIKKEGLRYGKDREQIREPGDSAHVELLITGVTTLILSHTSRRVPTARADRGSGRYPLPPPAALVARS